MSGIGRFCLTQQLETFYKLDKNWTEQTLLSAHRMLHRSIRNPFWAGIMTIPIKDISENTFRFLKTDFLDYAGSRDPHFAKFWGTLASHLFYRWQNRHKFESESSVSSIEFKYVLVRSNDYFRKSVLDIARTAMQRGLVDGMQIFRDLMKEVWPKQLAVKTKEVNIGLCNVAFFSEDNFPEVVTLIGPFLSRFQDRKFPLYSARTHIEKFPEQLLDLLYAILPLDARDWPYDTDEIIRGIEDSNSDLAENYKLTDLMLKSTNR